MKSKTTYIFKRAAASVQKLKLHQLPVCQVYTKVTQIVSLFNLYLVVRLIGRDGQAEESSIWAGGSR